MKRYLALILVLFACKLHAADNRFPQIATSTGTTLSVAVTTNPTLVLSTGAWNVYNFQPPPRSSTQPWVYSQIFSSNVVAGTLLHPRLHVEFYNDTGVNIYIGFNNQVSTQTGQYYGRKIPHGAAMAYDDCLPVWAVSESSTTVQKFVVTQEW